ncbi:hypothetical protein HLB44_26700 [Aquincola sp. S2]|uniref:Uncharacterized protein n=1 Tax=Pseudaquabacterium terrae TaxID=2732868 RepID=A0ABX2EQ33_9BURK|nr:hypothetical protein [Aquabacterium terrae]NRF70599.1 hypothetical protein [Aquabacterium terrae]
MSAMQAVFDRILAGDAHLLDGFAVQRVVTSGRRTESGICIHEDRLDIAGDGRVRLALHRSLSDMPGRQVGVFETQVPADVVVGLVRLLKAHPFETMPRSQIRPVDTVMRLSVVAGGMVSEFTFASTDRDAAASLRPLLGELATLLARAEEHPSMTLGLMLAAPERVAIGESRLAVSVAFGNFGSQGYWMTHPAHLAGGDDLFVLLYGRLPEVRDDQMPPPLEIARVPLEVSVRPVPDLVWMGPRTKMTIECSAEVRFQAGGPHFMRAGYCTYGGEATIASQPRFVGGVFASDIEVLVT